MPSNQRPARGRPRKVLDSLVCYGVYEKFVVMHRYINTIQMFKNALFSYCLLGFYRYFLLFVTLGSFSLM